MFKDRQIIHDRIRFFALLVFVFSLPYSLLINNISVFLLGINWLFESSFLTKWHRLKQNFIAFSLIQLYLVYVLGLTYSTNIHHGFFELEKKLALLLFPLILATSNFIPKTTIRSILKAFILSCTLASVICLSYAMYLNYKEGYTFSYLFNAVFIGEHNPDMHPYLNYWYFTYELFAMPIHMHPVYFAMYLLFSCCSSIWLWWKNDGVINKKRTLFIVLFLLYNFIIVVLLSSRMQLFLMLLFGTLFIVHQAYLKKKFLTGIITVCSVYALGLLIILSIPFLRERIIESNMPGKHFSNNNYGEGGLSLRKYKWKYTLETIKENPVLGTGTGDSEDQLQLTYLKNNFKIGYDNKFNAHNQFLETTLEIGILGLISLILSFLIPFYYAIKNKQWFYMLFLCLFLGSCLTESMLEVNKGIVFYSFFNSLIVFSFH